MKRTKFQKEYKSFSHTQLEIEQAIEKFGKEFAPTNCINMGYIIKYYRMVT